MPEMRFHIRWPDGATQSCYSPSLVVKEHLTPGESYPLADFLARVSTALTIASERVAARYGFACSRALAEIARLEAAARAFAQDPDARVRVESFQD